MFLYVEIYLLLLKVSVFMAEGKLNGDTKIINGQNAAENEFPFIVSLQHSGQHFCGGNIISPRFVLTAAHCFCSGRYNALHLENVTVVYGSLDLDSINQTYTNVIGVICHPKYESELGMTINDITILELSKAIPAAYKPITLAGHYYYDGSKNRLGTAVGWGINATGCTKPMNILQKVELIVYRNSICNRAMSDRLRYFYHVCSGWPGDNRGVCQGDSGGPLLIKNVLIGITAFGERVCELSGKDHPHVFTRVSSYVDWVKGIVPDVKISGCSSRNPTKKNISVLILLHLTLLFKWEASIFC